jgi:hypothetical protein
MAELTVKELELLSKGPTRRALKAFKLGTMHGMEMQNA